MTKYVKLSYLVLSLVLVLCSLSEGRIARVARKYHMLDFYAGYATPHGKYEKIGDAVFVDQNSRPISLDADEWLDQTYFFGFDYGTLYSAHWLAMLGFRFTDHNVMDIFQDIPADDITYRQYDVELNLNYMFNDLGSLFWSPYVGLGTQAGFTSLAEKGSDDQSNLNVALSLNFGVDVKIWGSPENRSFVTLSSINNFNLVGSGNRPNYFNIGAGLKYYFRP